MVSAPWEPHPERKRQLEKRARRPRNKHTQQNQRENAAKSGRRKKNENRHHPATDSSFSSSSSTDGHARGGGAAGYDADSVATSCGSSGWRSLKGGDGPAAARVRPEDCWCLHAGGCGDEDGCCVEDLPGVVACPCFGRISMSGVFEVRRDVKASISQVY